MSHQERRNRAETVSKWLDSPEMDQRSFQLHNDPPQWNVELCFIALSQTPFAESSCGHDEQSEQPP